jgi:hypothetical protein
MKAIILIGLLFLSTLALADNSCQIVSAGGPNSFNIDDKASEGLLNGILETNKMNEWVEKANNLSGHTDAIPSKQTSKGTVFEARLICIKSAFGTSCSVEGKDPVGDLSRALEENCGGKAMLYRAIHEKMENLCKLTAIQ